jgi:hypothetical protein
VLGTIDTSRLPFIIKNRASAGTPIVLAALVYHVNHPRTFVLGTIDTSHLPFIIEDRSSAGTPIFLAALVYHVNHPRALVLETIDTSLLPFIIEARTSDCTSIVLAPFGSASLILAIHAPSDFRLFRTVCKKGELAVGVFLAIQWDTVPSKKGTCDCGIGRLTLIYNLSIAIATIHTSPPFVCCDFAAPATTRTTTVLCCRYAIMATFTGPLARLIKVV